MPSNPSPIGALPARFRRRRILIVGCGDVGTRVAGLLPASVRVFALTSTPARVAGLRRQNLSALHGDLDAPATLKRLAGLAHRVLHLAPPANTPAESHTDRRTRSLLHALALRGKPDTLVYGSTTGVYGDCGGELVRETRTPAPGTNRAARRLDAEGRLRWFGRRTATTVHILRIPGIYAPDRERGTLKARLHAGGPVLRSEDDVYTNHIHADDLARACVAALWRGLPQRVTQVNDDTRLMMGDYFDLAADIYGLPRPPRISRAEALQQLGNIQLSFMSESRRLDNRRLKTELRLALDYATVQEGLAAIQGRQTSSHTTL